MALYRVRWRRGPFAGLATAALVSLLVLFAGSHAGELLVERDAMRPVDTVVILAGAPVELSRVLEGRDVLQAGWATRIILSPEATDPAVDRELARLGLPNANEQAVQVLVGSGVPAENITLLAESDSTRTEARRVRDSFGEHWPARLAVVTSPFHTRRACFVFRQLLPGVEVTCVPTRYEYFDTARWWADRVYWRHAAAEYAKWAVNAVELLTPGGY
jgi:uncharacterized SAM-binding protein YcdF (DUF218 family)